MGTWVYHLEVALQLQIVSHSTVLRWCNCPNGLISVLQGKMMLFIVLYFNERADSKLSSNLVELKVSLPDLSSSNSFILIQCSCLIVRMHSFSTASTQYASSHSSAVMFLHKHVD